jgi:iron complex outermembrane recepter protein
MISKFILTLAAVCACCISFSQTLQGKVTDAATGKTLSGATVSFSQKNTVVSNSTGAFSLGCKSPDVISISFVGYKTFRQKITDCNSFLNIALEAAETNLNEVEITATSNKNKTLLFQPASIAKISLTEIKRGTGLFLDDVINTNVPGVQMQKRSVSGGQSFNIRGYGNGARGTRGISSNFDGQGYKVYLNGIPVTDAEGITLMDDIDFGSVGNVEIIKGPSGTLYGLAIAGVVNLKTIKAEKNKTSAGQDVLIGNYGLQRYTTHFKTGTENSSILLNYGHQKSDGFSAHAASKKDFVNITGDFNPDKKQNISAYFGYSNSYDERSGELTIDQYEAGDYSGNIEYIKRNAHSKAISFRAGLGHTYTFSEKLTNTTTVFGTSLVTDASSAGGFTDKTTANYGVRTSFDTKFTAGNNVVITGITGAEIQNQKGQLQTYGMVKDPRDTQPVWMIGNPYYIIGATTSNVATVTTTGSYFTEWTATFLNDFSVTAGIGLSNMKIRLDDKFYVAATPDKTRQYDTTYKNLFSPHLALNKVFNKNVSLYASYNRGYKAPVSSYFFIPYVVGQSQAGIVNKNLQPEIGDQFEIGSKGSLLQQKLIYQLGIFKTVFSKKMTAVAVPFNSTTTLFSYITNGGKQDDKGIEALVKYTAFEKSLSVIRKVSLFANAAYSDFKYKNFSFQTIGKTVSLPQKDSAFTIDYSDKEVAGVPKFAGNAGMDIDFAAGIYANITYQYKDRMPITSTNTLYSKSYNLLNAKIGFRRSFSTHVDLDLFLGTDNITNIQFPYMVFVNQLPDAYVPAPRHANVYGGLNMQYNF